MRVDGKLIADWIVIAARFAGLAAARRMSQLCPTDAIAAVDACHVADGPASRNSGFMIDIPHDLSSVNYDGTLDKDAALIANNRHAIAFAANMVHGFGIGEDLFTRSGKINGAATTKGDRHNRDYAAHPTALDEPPDMLHAAAMKALTGTTP